MLVANRRFKYLDRVFGKGDLIDPEPDPVTRAKWERTGYALSADVIHARVGGLGCECGYVGITRRALDAHPCPLQASDPGASAPAKPDAPTVSTSPGAPEPAGESDPPPPPAGVLCPDCTDGKVYKSAQGLKVHRSRAH